MQMNTHAAGQIPHYHTSSATDAIRNQLMTLFMFKASGSSSSGGASDNIYTMVYSMIVLMLVEKIMAALPYIAATLQSYINARIKNSKLVMQAETTVMGVAGPRKKTSSITVELSLKNADNVIGHAMLEYITNLPNTRSIVYRHKTFSLNHGDPILIDAPDEIYMVLKNPTTSANTTLFGGSGAGGAAAEDEANGAVQIMEIYSFIFEIDELRAFLDRIVYDYKLKIQNKLGDKLYFFNVVPYSSPRLQDGTVDYSRLPPAFTFTMKPFVTNRRFGNVIGEQSELIRRRVEFFKNNKRWYDEKGVPYTLGLLLSGPPGGGKTSTIKCVANEMRRHIINVSLHADITKTQMENLFFNETITVVANGRSESYTIPIDRRLYVFEDIDCQGCDVVFERNKTAPEEECDDDAMYLFKNGKEGKNTTIIKNISLDFQPSDVSILESNKVIFDEQTTGGFTTNKIIVNRAEPTMPMITTDIEQKTKEVTDLVNTQPDLSQEEKDKLIGQFMEAIKIKNKGPSYKTVSDFRPYSAMDAMTPEFAPVDAVYTTDSMKTRLTDESVFKIKDIKTSTSLPPQEKKRQIEKIHNRLHHAYKDLNDQGKWNAELNRAHADASVKKPAVPVFPETQKTQPDKRADNPTLENGANLASEKLTLSCLLNLLDGILETPGRIIIMTSNYPQKLDRALIRPGRIDLLCEFTKCTHDMIIKFFEKFYDITLSEEEREKVQRTPPYKYSPAEMTRIMFENFDDWQKGLECL